MSESRRNVSSGDAFESVFGYSKAVRAGNQIAQVFEQAHKEIFDSIGPASTIIQVDSMLRTWQWVEMETYAINQ